MNITMGSIIATSNLDVVKCSIMNGFKAMYIGDPMYIPQDINLINGSIFTPDYQVMSLIIDSNDDMFTKAYIDYLNGPQCEEMFAVLIAALFKGINIILYFPEDSIQLKYPILFMQFLFNRYGVVVGDNNTPFSFNMALYPSNMRLLYLYSLIDWRQYILSVEDLDQYVLSKLRQDICPIYQIPFEIDDNSFVQEITKIKDKLLHPEVKKLFEVVNKE